MINMSLKYLKEENIRKAISGYKNALKGFTLEDFKLEYASVQISLGLALSELAGVRDMDANLGLALAAYKEA